MFVLTSSNWIFRIKQNSDSGKWQLVFNNDSIDGIVKKILSIIIISIIMYLTIKVGNILIRKFVEKQVASKIGFSLDPQKAITIGEVLKSVLKYIVYCVGIGAMLADVIKQIPVAVASAGGFAIGIGAQSLVKDLINGFFILFEDQYGVGDHITIDEFTGIVESIGIRTTIIRDFTGDLHLIPNGSVLEVTNHSRGDIRFIVDVEIAYEENIDETIQLIKNVSKSFEEKHSDKLRGPIDVLGVLSLNASGVTIRTIGRSAPLSQWEMERELRKDIKIALDKAGIEIPYPKTAIVKQP